MRKSCRNKGYFLNRKFQISHKYYCEILYTKTEHVLRRHLHISKLQCKILYTQMFIYLVIKKKKKGKQKKNYQEMRSVTIWLAVRTSPSKFKFIIRSFNGIFINSITIIFHQNIIIIIKMHYRFSIMHSIHSQIYSSLS